MTIMNDNPLWAEKYRPKRVQDCILPEDLKTKFQKFVDDEMIPMLLLSGGSGQGKTTIARAMLEELGCDYIIINASLDGNIDTLRNDIRQFASSVSLTGSRKYVILDEADYLRPNFQPSMRNFTEEYSKNCGFILTCNYKNRIIEPIKSRCSEIDFKIGSKEAPALCAEFFKRVCWILEQENVPYEKPVLAEVIKKHYPDWRKCLIELQTYSATGAIDSGILANIQELSLKNLLTYMKDKDFTGVRKWVAENNDSNADVIYRKIYDQLSNIVVKDFIPQCVLIIGKYQFQHGLCADTEINLACCLLELMIEVEFL